MIILFTLNYRFNEIPTIIKIGPPPPLEVDSSQITRIAKRILKKEPSGRTHTSHSHFVKLQMKKVWYWYLGRKILSGGRCLVHWRTFSNICLYPPDISRRTQLGQSKMSPNVLKCLLEGKITLVGNHCSRYYSFPKESWGQIIITFKKSPGQWDTMVILTEGKKIVWTLKKQKCK